MYTNKRLPKRLTFSMVIVLAIILSFSMLITGFVTAKPVYAANYDSNYDYSSMLKDISGTSVSGNTVTSNGRTDTGSDGVNQWSYFPTKYLELSEEGTYDLSGLLQQSVTSTLNNSPQQYNNNPKNRFIGIERRGYVQMTSNDNAPELWKPSNENKGKGIYQYSPNGKQNGSDFEYKTAFYFTIQVPEYVKNISVSIDSYYYGEWEDNYLEDYRRRLESSMAIYEIKNPADLFKWDGNLPETNGVGFSHSKNWTETNRISKSFGGDNVVAEIGSTDICNAWMYSTGGKPHQVGTKTINKDLELKNTKRYMSIVIANDFLVGSHGNLDIKYLLTNLKIGIKMPPEAMTTTKPANKTDWYNKPNDSEEYKHSLIPYANLEVIPKDGFTGLTNNNAKIAPKITDLSQIDLSIFGGVHDDNNLICDNGVLKFEKGKPTLNSWRYIFAYFQIPDNYKGKKIKITADFNTYGINTYTYMSASPAVEFYEAGAKYNVSDARHNPHYGVTNGWRTYKAEKNNQFETKELVLDLSQIREAIGFRLSFVSFPKEVDKPFGMEIKNVKVQLVDEIAPDMTNVKNDLKHAVDSKEYIFSIIDDSDISVSVDGYSVEEIGNKTYKIVLNENVENLNITATDTWGNSSTKRVNIGNIIHFGTGFNSKNVINNGEQIEANISINDEDLIYKSLKNPSDVQIPGATISGNVSINSATYNIKFNNPVYTHVLINAASFIDVVDFLVKAETKEERVLIGNDFTTPDVSKAKDGFTFVGWVDDRNVLVSENPIYTFKVLRNITLTAKYVENGKTKVIFMSPSGSIIDIKEGEYNNLKDIQDNISTYQVAKPLNFFMNFDRWEVEEFNGEFIAKATFNVTEQVEINVGINCDDATITPFNTVLFNKRVVIPGDENTIAWAVKDEKGTHIIAETKDLEFFATSDMTVFKMNNVTLVENAEKSQSASGVRISEKRNNNDVVITGIVTPFTKDNSHITSLENVEVGFMIDHANSDLNIYSKTAARFTVRLHPETNQAIINIDSTKLTGHKVTMYVRTSDGKYHYSNTITL